MIRCARAAARSSNPELPWDLGHVDGTERTVYSGPEHRRCNRQTATHRAQQHEGRCKTLRKW
jgi:hypothetical protein